MTDQLKRKLGVPLLVFYGVGIFCGIGMDMKKRRWYGYEKNTS